MGAEVCEEIHKVSPRTRVLLISGAERISPNVARAAGAAGFISPDWSAVDVASAPCAASPRATRPSPKHPLDSPLSDQRAPGAVADQRPARPSKEIAALLHLSPHTVKEHAVRST